VEGASLKLLLGGFAVIDGGVERGPPSVSPSDLPLHRLHHERGWHSAPPPHRPEPKPAAAATQQMEGKASKTTGAPEGPRVAQVQRRPKQGQGVPIQGGERTGRGG